MIVSRMTDTHDGNVITRGQRVSLTLRTAFELPSNGGAPLARVESDIYPPIWGHASCEHENDNIHKDSLSTPSTEKEHVHAYEESGESYGQVPLSS